MKKLALTLILFSFLLPTSNVFGNAAQPGFWNAGAGHEFIPLVAGDSVFIGNIRMAREDISILLFPGYAVVRGDYWMENTVDSTISMTVGYPVNGEMQQPGIHYIMFDDLYQMQVLVNGSPVEYGKLEVYDSVAINPRKHIWSEREWYTWKMSFEKDSLTHIRVYFIVNTNDAKLREGYGVLDNNGFAYILESGKAWGGTIGKGRIRMQLAGGLKSKSIGGILPAGSFSWDGKSMFVREFENLEPEPESNVIVRYNKRNKNFDFESILKTHEELFKAVDELAESEWDVSTFKVFEAADFNVPGPIENLRSSAITIFFWLLGGAIALVIVLYVFMRWRKSRR